jgi:hypothetical protein
VSDWWARKLGTAPPANRPSSTPDVWAQQRHAQPTPAYAAPPQSPVPPYDAPEAAPDGKMHVGDAIVRWRGGEATRTETESCPQCQSHNFFSRRGAGGVTTQNGRVPPSPICHDCGYNGIFTNFGGTATDKGALV